MEVASLFNMVRNSRQQLQAFNFTSERLAHGRDLVSRKHHTHFEKTAMAFFYHCDPTQQYRNVIGLGGLTIPTLSFASPLA